MPAALDAVGTELLDGTFAFAPADEDIHTAIERRVTELAGPPAAKLHTGRSRNDQVATDLRLFFRREGTRRRRVTCTRSSRCCWRAPRRPTTSYLPGYTHLQRAQPVLLAHHLLAHFWALGRDVERLAGMRSAAPTCRRWAPARWPGRACRSIPTRGRRDLGFARRFDNSLDAVSDRDFVAEALFVASLAQVHLSRLGEEIVLWSQRRVRVPAAGRRVRTGSSMLPQKKNPDVAELAGARPAG